jgi:hypothetical protein
MACCGFYRSLEKRDVEQFKAIEGRTDIKRKLALASVPNTP